MDGEIGTVNLKYVCNTLLEVVLQHVLTFLKSHEHTILHAWRKIITCDTV